jgi:hypothetical protein
MSDQQSGSMSQSNDERHDGRPIDAEVDPRGGERTPLDEVEAPVPGAALTLTSGRRYDLEAGAEADRLVVRSRGGEIVLRIEITDAGPVLSFSGASIELAATQGLRLAAREVSIEATGDVLLSAGGSLHERIAGEHHTRVDGNEWAEAATVQLQANVGAVGVRAMGRIALDGEHIGLNDDPEPKPFPWSAIAGGPEQD